jgi:U4/U6.U5 tri-snRNP-associated protein 2
MSSATKRKADEQPDGGASAASAAPAAKRAAFASGAASSAAADDSPHVKAEPMLVDGVKEEGDSIAADVKDEDVEEEAYKPTSHLDGMKRSHAEHAGGRTRGIDRGCRVECASWSTHSTTAAILSPLYRASPMRRDSAGDIICPYLDTINRRALDFDFSKLCSISLSDVNVYACLVCGKYFQGRGKKSYAYAHALEDAGHHVFLNLVTEEIYCLPDGYRIGDRSLDDIGFNLRPKYSRTDVRGLDKHTQFVHALDGTDYLPGLVGLNNVRHTDWLNVIVQAFNFIPKLRNYFLLRSKGESGGGATKGGVKRGTIKTEGAHAAASATPAAAASSSAAASSAVSVTAASSSSLSVKYGELLCKIWNPRSFKGHVSPHELLQSLSSLSGKRFAIGKFADCLQVLAFLLRELHRELGGTKKRSSIVTETFQGEIRVVTEVDAAEVAADADQDEKDAEAAKIENAAQRTVEYKPFLYLSLTLPAAPLFKDTTDRAIIPQIPLFELLKKFDGHTVEAFIDPLTRRATRRTYTITRLPRNLILHYQRFAENAWFWEKNPTLVSFPLEELDMSKYLDASANLHRATSDDVLKSLSIRELKTALIERKVAKVESIVEKPELVSALRAALSSVPPPATRYKLLSNIVHDGKPSGKELVGSYKCHTLHTTTNTWYATEDLHVWTTETMPQLVALSEAYIQVYQLQQE